MYHNDSTTNHAQPSAARRLSPDETFDDFVLALEYALNKQERAITTHSFQIVRLFNQIQQLQQENLRQADEKRQVQEELMRSQREIAYLKGRVAGLAMELYLTSTNTRHDYPDDDLLKKWMRDSIVKLPPHASPRASSQLGYSTFEDSSAEASRTAGVVADQLWDEQRPGLMRALNYCLARQPVFGPSQEVFRDVSHETTSSLPQEDP
ncbi:hypothetical protein E4U21_006522 [Claviceps maximensis]|nr:hypothetical protein E4U21_006522 [Claviceps maximensis]